MRRTASSLYAPGSPWKATRGVEPVGSIGFILPRYRAGQAAVNRSRVESGSLRLLRILAPGAELGAVPSPADRGLLRGAGADRLREPTDTPEDPVPT
jgi:hypothetical protein